VLTSAIETALKLMNALIVLWSQRKGSFVGFSGLFFVFFCFFFSVSEGGKRIDSFSFS
jgi:hypothetical protein